MEKIDRSDLISHVQKLPAMSAVVTELLTTIDQQDIDVGAIAKKISHDQALTVKTLRLANSSFYGVQHKISSVHEAINILGFKNVRMLIATSAITASFNPTKIKHFSFSSFWKQSIGTAICAREIASHTGRDPEFAFVAGLIRDIGKLVLATHYPNQYEKALEFQAQQRCDPEVAELEILGLDHGEISQSVLQHWKFPQEMQTAVSEQYCNDDQTTNQLSGIIHLANIFSLALDFSNDDNAVVPKISPRVWNRLRLDETSCRKIFRESVNKFNEISHSLNT